MLVSTNQRAFYSFVRLDLSDAADMFVSKLCIESQTEAAVKSFVRSYFGTKLRRAYFIYDKIYLPQIREDLILCITRELAHDAKFIF